MVQDEPRKQCDQGHDRFYRRLRQLPQEGERGDAEGIDDAEAPDAVVRRFRTWSNAKEPKFSNPVGKMVGMFLFLQSYAPKMFEGSILKSVSKAA